MTPLDRFRKALAQAGAEAAVIVCSGCCCGHVEKGNAFVDAAALEAAEKAGLLGAARLEITGCLGPCGLANVACVKPASGDAIWFKGLGAWADYEALISFAAETASAAVAAPIPKRLSSRTFDERKERLEREERQRRPKGRG